jgi:hypothetical protein
VCLTVKPVGEPDAGNRHVRFDERGWETERCRMAQATAPILDSTMAEYSSWGGLSAAGESCHTSEATPGIQPSAKHSSLAITPSTKHSNPPTAPPHQMPSPLPVVWCSAGSTMPRCPVPIRSRHDPVFCRVARSNRREWCAGGARRRRFAVCARCARDGAGTAHAQHRRPSLGSLVPLHGTGVLALAGFEIKEWYTGHLMLRVNVEGGRVKP